jgi:hypothetical protein
MSCFWLDMPFETGKQLNYVVSLISKSALKMVIYRYGSIQRKTLNPFSDLNQAINIYFFTIISSTVAIFGAQHDILILLRFLIIKLYCTSESTKKWSKWEHSAGAR